MTRPKLTSVQLITELHQAIENSVSTSDYTVYMERSRRIFNRFIGAYLYETISIAAANGISDERIRNAFDIALKIATEQ